LARVIDKPLLVNVDAIGRTKRFLLQDTRFLQSAGGGIRSTSNGDGFDLEAFSADEVNRRLAPLQRHRNKAAAGRK
jgi:hypothetical protein